MAFYAYFGRLEASAIDDSLNSQAQALSSGIDASNGRIAFQGGDPLPNETPEGIAVDAVLVDAHGAILDRSGQAPPTETVSAMLGPALAADHPVFQPLLIHGVDERVRAQRITAGGHNVVLIVSRATIEETARLHRTALLLVLIVATLTATGSTLGYIMAGRALRPVRVLAATARELSEHDLHRRIDLRLPADEIGELGATFNELLGRLEAAFASLQRFTADAAHELRAPLAVMLSEVEVALREPREAGAYRVNLVNLRSEIERLARLADQLLVLARADAGVLQPSRIGLDVADFLEEIVARWRPLVAEHGLQIDTDLPDAGHIEADAELLRRVVDNLLDNAVKHTPAGGRIDIQAGRHGGLWGLSVSDTGPGIPGELRESLFERFSRPDLVRGRETGGAGLGLALSLAIVEAHGGRIQVESRPGEGARFLVTLPAVATGQSRGSEPLHFPFRSLRHPEPDEPL